MPDNIETEEAPCGVYIAVGYIDKHIISCTWCRRHVKKLKAISRDSDKPKKNSLEALKAMFRSSK